MSGAFGLCTAAAFTCQQFTVDVDYPEDSRAIWRNRFFFFFCFFRAALAAYGSSQARGGIGARAASLHHRHSKVESEPYFQLTPQFTAMLDP